MKKKQKELTIKIILYFVIGTALLYLIVLMLPEPVGELAKNLSLGAMVGILVGKLLKLNDKL